MSPMIFSHGSYTPQCIHWDAHDISPPMTQGLKLTVIQLTHSPYLTDALTTITYVHILVSPTSSSDTIQRSIMVLHQVAINDHVLILSPHSRHDGCTGTIIKITAKCIAIALNALPNVPLDLHQKIYLLPKHLHVLEFIAPNPEDPSTSATESDTYSSSDLDSISSSDSSPLSVNKDNFYQELMLLRL